MHPAYAVIPNREIGVVPPTPLTPADAGEATPESHITLRTWGASYGFCLGYKQEQGGRLVQNILPNPKTETQQISTSSKVRLAMHTETSFHPYRPSYVMLLCLRGDPNAITTVAGWQDIMRRLSLQTIRTLAEPRFVTTIDDSFRLNGEPDRDIPISVIYELPNGAWALRYDELLTRGIDDGASLALAELTATCEQVSHDVVLRTGDLLILNNAVSVHGRKPFTPRYDGTDRWIQRMMVFDYPIPERDLDGCVITTDL